MVKMNFPTLGRKWTLECVTIALTSMLVNGSSAEKFKMERENC